jgi:cytidylate kinase
VIAIDGPAGSGKSTTARLTAARLGFSYLDTGAMYRVVALLSLRDHIPADDPDSLSRLVSGHTILALDGSILLDEEDVSGLIRSATVGERASIVSRHSSVRRALVPLQRKASAGDHQGVVAEGRDMGTVVFPDAALKVFVTADLACRALRRKLDLDAAARRAGERPSPLGQVVASLLKRDRRDRTRTDSPLRRAPDSHLIDTTLMSVEQQVTAVVELYEATRPPSKERSHGRLQ